MKNTANIGIIKNGTIVVTDDWTKKEHPKVSAEYKPYAVVDVLSQKGKQTDRMYYDADGRQLRQVSTGRMGIRKGIPTAGMENMPTILSGKMGKSSTDRQEN